MKLRYYEEKSFFGIHDLSMPCLIRHIEGYFYYRKDLNFTIDLPDELGEWIRDKIQEEDKYEELKSKYDCQVKYTAKAISDLEKEIDLFRQKNKELIDDNKLLELDYDNLKDNYSLLFKENEKLKQERDDLRIKLVETKIEVQKIRLKVPLLSSDEWDREYKRILERDDKPKLCINCFHYNKPVEVIEAWCSRPITNDLVDGSIVVCTNNCKHERDHDCGQEGKYFKPRT